MLPFVHSELPFMHRGIEKYKDFVIFKVYYYILSILRKYGVEMIRCRTLGILTGYIMCTSMCCVSIFIKITFKNN